MKHFDQSFQTRTTTESSAKKILSVSAKYFLVICLFILAMLRNNAMAQPGQQDASFNPVDNGINFIEGAAGNVYTIALQPDGKILIGGSFISFNGVTANRIARLNADGNIDPTFNVAGAGANNSVNEIVLQADGKIIIGGAFTSYNGNNLNYLARLNADGSADAGFNTGTGFNDAVNALALQADGKLLAAGAFSSYNAAAVNHLVRINTTGTRDVGFTGTIANSVNDIAIQADGKILIGINNDQNGLVSNFLVRLSGMGTNDAAFNSGGSGANSSVKAIRIQADGKILFGGDFNQYNSLTTNLTRINTNGTPDAAYNNTSGGFPEGIKSIALQSDGKIVVGWGAFLTDAYDEGARVNRLNANGTSDASFTLDFYPDLAENVFTVAVQPDGKILAGETLLHNWTSNDREANYFGSRTYLGARDFKISRYNTNGSRDQDFAISPAQTGANRTINTMVTQADNKIIIGGYFYSYNGVSTNYLARLNADGSKDAGFNAGGTGPNAYVYTSITQADGKILIGGMFSTYNGTASGSIIRLNADGSRDASFTYTQLPYGGIKSLSLQPDGKIMAGGFGTLIRLNADGTQDPSFSVSFRTGYGYFFPYIDATVVQPDGKIIVGGYFSGVIPVSAGPGLQSRNLARLNADGSPDDSFTLSIGPDYEVFSLALQPDGKFIAGGAFANGNYLLRYNTNGTADATFNAGGTGIYNPPGGTIVNKVFLQPDGKILVGGNFTAYNSTPVNGILRLNANGSLDAGFNTSGAGTAAVNSVSSLALQYSGSKILLAGSFTIYNNTGKNRIARIFGSDAGAAVPVTTIATICASELPYTWNGNTYNTTGIYTASVVNPGGAVTVDTLKLTIGAGNITGPDRACQFISNGTNASYQIAIPAGSTITWSVSKPASMTISSGQGTDHVNIQYNNSFTSGYVYARVINSSCSIDVKRSLLVSKTLPSTPAAIVAGPVSVCAVIGTFNVVSFTIRKTNGATSYNWSAQAGSTTITHPNAAGINDTTINIKFANNFTTSAVTVQAVNDCGTSNIRSLTITRSGPSTPGAISGLTDVCGFTTDLDDVVYSVPEVAGNTYSWTVPAGASLFAYMTPSRNQIVVRFTDGYTTGVISVMATNGCGTSTARNLTVRKIVVSTPGAITAANISACPDRQYTYSLAGMPSHATYVQWVVPAGGTIISGQGTTSITVSYSAAAISGYVSAQGMNSCSSSSLRKLTQNLPACPPATPFAREGNADQKVSLAALNFAAMEVKIFPNPSVSDFKLLVNSSAKDPVKVKIYDVQARLINEMNIAANETVNLGATLKTGAYIIEVRQGSHVKTTKVLKF